MLKRVVLTLYLSTLVLLPWSWFPPFPWLHVHAQWSDAVFAVTTVAWVFERVRTRSLRLNAIHVMAGVYFTTAVLSLLFGSPDPWSAAPKLLGTAELCMLLIVTSDLASDLEVSRSVSRVVALTSLAAALAAMVGLILFYAGIPTQLVGSYGDLIPSHLYARVESGTYNPNLLTSYCIFASAVVAREHANLSRKARRIVQIALWITVLLTFSRAILGFILGAILRTSRVRQRPALMALAAVACLSIIVTLTVWNLSFDPTHPLQTHFERDVASSRWQTMTSSLRTLAAHPLFGSGLGTPPGSYRGVPMNAHLTPLNIAAKLGIPALAAFVSIVVLIWRRRPRPTDFAVWGGLAGLALDGLAQDIESFRHVWVLLGLAAGRSMKK